jgi:pyruvate formate lyase activating enzyme
MRIAGMQKLSTVDFPGLLAAVVFTQGCNFHCPYCHNPQLLLEDAAGPFPDTEELLAFLRKRAGRLDGLVISGGEPTLQPGLADFCGAARKIGYRVKLDTNGSRPEILHTLLAGGLVDHVAMDCKSPLDLYAPALCPEADVAEKIGRSAALLRESGIAHEFRSTCVSPFITAEGAPALYSLMGRSSPWYLQRARLTSEMRNRGLQALSTEEMRDVARVARRAGVRAALRQGT